MRKKLEQALYRWYPGLGFAFVWFGIPLLIFQVLGLGGWADLGAIVLGGAGALLVHRGPAYNLDGSPANQEISDAP